MIFSACSSERNVVSGVEDNASFGEYGIVFNLSLADSGAVVGENDKLGFSVSEGSKG